MERKQLQSLGEMGVFAHDFVSKIQVANRATLITLQGDLGAGKTAFVKECAKAFGVTDTVTSPTFVIEKIYKLENQKFDYLIHIDAYRLEKAQELTGLGWAEILEDPKNIIFLEWPERVEEVLPKEKKELRFAFVDEGVREITF